MPDLKCPIDRVGLKAVLVYQARDERPRRVIRGKITAYKDAVPPAFKADVEFTPDKKGMLPMQIPGFFVPTDQDFYVLVPEEVQPEEVREYAKRKKLLVAFRTGSSSFTGYTLLSRRFVEVTYVVKYTEVSDIYHDGEHWCTGKPCLDDSETSLVINGREDGDVPENIDVYT